MAKISRVIDYDSWPQINLMYFIEYPDMGITIEFDTGYNGKITEFDDVDPENIDMRKFMGYKKPYNIHINIERNEEDFKNERANWLKEPDSAAGVLDAPFDPVLRDIQTWIIKAILGEVYYGQISG
jgi:hypothetical protein